MNAREIATRRFEKSAFGYKPEEVDAFLRDISNEFASLQKEKDDCEKKIEVLADKIRDYMKDEEALKEALLGAQRQGHQVLEESRLTANRIIAEANEKAESIVGQTKYQLEKEKEALANVKKEVSDFKTRLFSLYKSHFEILQDIPDYDEESYPSQQPEMPVNNHENAVSEETKQADNVHEEISQEQYAGISDQHLASASPFSKPAFSTQETRHADLRFGSNNK